MAMCQIGTWLRGVLAGFRGDLGLIRGVENAVQRQFILRRLALHGLAVGGPVATDQAKLFQLREVPIDRAPRHFAVFGKPALARVAQPGVVIVAIGQIPQNDLHSRLYPPLRDGPICCSVAQFNLCVLIVKRFGQSISAITLYTSPIRTARIAGKPFYIGRQSRRLLLRCVDAGI